MKLKQLVAAAALAGVATLGIANDQSFTMLSSAPNSYTGLINVSQDVLAGGDDLLSFLLPNTATAGSYFVTFAYFGQNVTLTSLTLNGMLPSFTGSAGVPGILTTVSGFGSGETNPPFLVTAVGSTVTSAFNIPSSYSVGVTASLVQAAPVPEPESYAMFLAGLGIIGAVAKRRSKRA